MVRLLKVIMSSALMLSSGCTTPPLAVEVAKPPSSIYSLEYNRCFVLHGIMADGSRAYKLIEGNKKLREACANIYFPKEAIYDEQEKDNHEIYGRVGTGYDGREAALPEEPS